MVGVHLLGFGTFLVTLLVLFVPWAIGFGYVLPDANRHGQPGWLWAVLTIPFGLGWLTLLAYVIVRAIRAA